MKKIGLSLVIVLGVILLAGCGNIDFSKTSHIICSKTEENSVDTTTTVMTFSYDKNEKIENFKVETNTIYKNSMSKEAMEITEKAMKLIGTTMGLGFESSVTDNSIAYSFSGNIKTFKVLMKQLNKDYKEENVTGDTKQEAITELSKDGYTCEDIKK